MEIMEKLYNRGYLSYPRTETNSYQKSINIRELVGKFDKSEEFGNFVDKMLNGQMWAGPRNGYLNDMSHPPIHPVKMARQSDLDPQ